MFGDLFRGIANFFQQFQFWFTVEPWDQCLRVRFGKHLKRMSPGIHLKIPYFDVLYKQHSRYRTAMCPTQTMTTKDGKTVVCSFALGYSLGDIEKFYQTLTSADSTLTQLVSAYVADEIADTNSADLKAVGISQLLSIVVADKFEKYGLKDITVSLQDFAFIKAFRLINDQRFNMEAPLNSTYGQTR